MITNLLVDAVHLLKESCIFIATCVTWFSRLRILWFDTSCGWKRLVVDAKLSPEGASVNARALYQSQTGNYLYISSKKILNHYNVEPDTFRVVQEQNDQYGGRTRDLGVSILEY
jgi:hypothetical protein